MNFFKLFATGYFFSLFLLAVPSFSADLAPNDAMISPHNRAVEHEGWSYKKIAIGSAVCTLCIISTTISPTIGLCTSSAAAIFGALYYFRNKGPILGEELCINSQDFTKTLLTTPEPEIVTTPPPDEKVSLASMLLHRSLSFNDLSIPLRDLQIKILNGAIEGISPSTIGSLAKVLAEKRTLNGIAINYEQITKNTNALYTELRETNTEGSIALKAEIENFFRHFNSNDIINKRIVIFLLLTSITLTATEEQYFLHHQDYEALRSYFVRLVIKFKELETGKGVNAEGMGILSVKTLKTEYSQLSNYAQKLPVHDENMGEALVKLAEISLQITHIARDDILQKIFRGSQSLDDVSHGIIDVLRQQSKKELTWHTSESEPADEITLRIFNLEGFYKVSPFKGKAFESSNLLKAEGIKYELQAHKNSYSEIKEIFYLRIWEDSNFQSKHVLDKSNKIIFKAIEEGKYKLIALAFGKDKSPSSTRRAFYLIPTTLHVPRLAQHDEISEPIIYRLHSPYKNTEEDLKALHKLFISYCP